MNGNKIYVSPFHFLSKNKLTSSGTPYIHQSVNICRLFIFHPSDPIRSIHQLPDTCEMMIIVLRGKVCHIYGSHQYLKSRM